MAPPDGRSRPRPQRGDGRSRPRPHPQRGQATIDYVALIAVLGLLLAAAAALAAGGGAGVTNAVVGQLRRALCVVSGGACPAERPQPCVVASRRDSDHAAISMAIVRADEDRYVLRERLSDGTVRLTLAQRSGAGVEGAVGARLRVRLKGRTIGFDREAQGAGQGVLGHGEVYVARDDREADEILRAIGGRARGIGRWLRIGRGGPRPREVFVEGGVRGLGRLGIGGQAAGMSLDGITDAMLGARRDQRSGEITISLGGELSGWALLTAVMAGPSGALDRQVGLGLTLDRRHRPIALSLTASGILASGSAVPPALAGPLGIGAGDDATVSLTGRRWELGARVDLRDRDVAAAWATFRHDPGNPAAIRALGALLRDEASMEVRSYAVRSEFRGVAGGLAFGLEIGGELDHTTDRFRLLSAATRPPGGTWERRMDCVAA
jgi:hypothetical protein